MPNHFKTWIEIDKRAAQANFKTIKRLLKPKTKLWVVVKSNAYGHGLIAFSKMADQIGVDGFCVDSVVEGEKLRREYIKKPILVLGPTLPDLFYKAVDNNITVTISTWEGLKALQQSKYKPNFHLKLDTGMHRQGFYVEHVPKVIRLVTSYRLPITGVYTHFASAKDINYPTFTELQYQNFSQGLALLDKAGYSAKGGSPPDARLPDGQGRAGASGGKNLIRHASATGAVMVNPKYNFDAVRVGIGLYGLWPSKELEVQRGREISLKPILSWRAIVSEVKNLQDGDYVGYDLTERVTGNRKLAIVPIGYWHGFPRALSGIGEVLIKGKRARVLGRVSMDLICVDVTGINCQVGDTATIIGSQNKEIIKAGDLAYKADTTHYEIVTCINPLIERIVL